MRRHVFYIHGFDPRGPAPYHAICAETAKARGIEITPRRKAGAGSSQWRLRAPGCEVAYEVLRYDDWVRELWPRWNGARRYGAALRVVFAFARSGVLTRLARWARPGFYAVLAQGFIGVAPYVLALALGAGVYAKASDWLALPYALALAAVLAGAAILLGRRLETRLNLAWFTRSLAYLLESALGEIVEREGRTTLFAARILELWRRGEIDEIVIVGHSLGAMLAVTTLAKVLEFEPQAAVSGPPIRFLTLGQSVPIFAQLDASGDFERAATKVARAFAWLDVTSPHDSASSGKIAILESAPDLILSLPTGHIDEKSSGLSRILRPLEFHFRYLRCADAERGFDYLTMLCGEAPIAPSQTSARDPSRKALHRV